MYDLTQFSGQSVEPFWKNNYFIKLQETNPQALREGGEGGRENMKSEEIIEELIRGSK